MSELLNALKRNLVNATAAEAEVLQARIDAIENPKSADASFDGPDPYPAPLSGLTKSELLDIAASVGMPGRSGMTKTELVEALEEEE
jgi:hypothetical protein